MDLKGIAIVAFLSLAFTGAIVFTVFKGNEYLNKVREVEAERPLDTITFYGPTQIIQFEGKVTSWGDTYVGFRDAQGTKHGLSGSFTIEFGKE